MKASELLRKAARLIREEGWLQRWYGDAANGFCSDGAIQYAARGMIAGYPVAVFDARHYFVVAAGLHVAFPESEVIRWNDARDRTKEQVLANFEKAAELAESEGR